MLSHDVAETFSQKIVLLSVAFAFFSFFFVRGLKTTVIVFDDFERCPIYIADLVGSINLYIDTGFKVLVLVDETMIEENFAAKRDKPFGRRTTKPRKTNSARDYLLNEIKCQHRSIIFRQCGLMVLFSMEKFTRKNSVQRCLLEYYRISHKCGNNCENCAHNDKNKLQVLCGNDYLILRKLLSDYMVSDVIAVNQYNELKANFIRFLTTGTRSFLYEQRNCRKLKPFRNLASFLDSHAGNMDKTTCIRFHKLLFACELSRKKSLQKLLEKNPASTNKIEQTNLECFIKKWDETFKDFAFLGESFINGRERIAPPPRPMSNGTYNTVITYGDIFSRWTLSGEPYTPEDGSSQN